MRQEPCIVTLTDIRLLSHRMEMETGLILMEMFTTSSMNRMHMMQKATAITGTEKQQTYIICLYSKREA